MTNDNMTYARELLGKVVKRHDELTVIHMSSAPSGMSATYMVFIGARNITSEVASVCGFTMSRDRRALRVRGTGTSRSFHIARSLSHELFGNPHELLDRLY